MQRKQKVALLVNLIAPYRVPILERIGRQADLTVLHGGSEPNRSWQVKLPPEVRAKEVFTLKLRVNKRTGSPGINDTCYIHLNFGLFYQLPRVRPDVIISNEMGLRSWIALIYGKIFRKPVWIWWGGTEYSEKNIGTFKKWSRRAFVCLCKRWISYGISATRYLQSLGVKTEDILQIQNCVPELNFSFREKAKLWFGESVGPVLLSVGQLTDRKGIDRLLHACGRLEANGFDFTLVIVGSGVRRNELVTLAKEVGLRNVLFLPEQTQKALNEIYRSSDVFVFPTLEDIWGLVVNEAILCGTPVLCSCYAGCAEELIASENIFDPLSESSFDHALRRVFDGGVHPAEKSRLRSCEEIGSSIANAILADG